MLWNLAIFGHDQTIMINDKVQRTETYIKLCFCDTSCINFKIPFKSNNFLQYINSSSLYFNY